MPRARGSDGIFMRCGKLGLNSMTKSKAGIMAEPDQPSEIEGSGHDDLAQKRFLFM